MSELLAILDFTVRHVLVLAPWFFAAIALGVLSQRLSLDVLARRAFRQRGVLAVVLTTCIGAFSPFCSFTVIPLVRQFLRAGVPLSAIMAFWVASPSMDPEIYALSAATFGFPVATMRLVGALTLSLGAGLIVLALERRGHFTDPLREDTQASAASPACSSVALPVAPAAVPVGAGAEQGGSVAVTTAPVAVSGGCPAAAAPPVSSCDAGSSAAVVDDGRPWRELARADLRNLSVRETAKEFCKDSVSLGKWLVVAVLVEALIVRYVPGELVAGTLGASGVLAIPLSAVLSVPLFLNGVGAIPIVSGLLGQGMSTGAAVTFLLAGALTTVPAVIAVRSVVKGSVFVYYMGVALLGSMLVGVVASVVT